MVSGTGPGTWHSKRLLLPKGSTWPSSQSYENVVTYTDQGGITGEKETKPRMDVGLEVLYITSEEIVNNW